MKKISLLSIIVICFSCVAFTGCEQPEAKSPRNISKPVIAGESHNNKEVTMAVGQELIIRLPANATTGYEWKRVATRTFSQSKETIISPAGEKYTPAASNKNLVGSGGIYEATFIGKTAGNVSMTFKYIRPWIGVAKDDKTFTIMVSVVK